MNITSNSLKDFKTVSVIMSNNGSFIDLLSNEDNRVEEALFCMNVKYEVRCALNGSAVVAVYGVKQANFRQRLERILMHL